MLNRTLKKRKFLAGSILTGFVLILAGCENKTEQAPVESKPETPIALPGPAATPGPVQPSPSPTLPVPGAPAPPDESKTADPKMEPKMEPPK